MPEIPFSEKFPIKSLEEKSWVIIDIYEFFEYWGYSPRIRKKTFLMIKNGEFLGKLYLPTATECDNKLRHEHKKLFKEFLIRFGKRMVIDDFLDLLVLWRRYRRYQIRFQTLLAGRLCFQRSPEEFIKNVREAKNEEEFIILTGLF